MLQGEYSKMSKGNRLAIPAVRQIMAKLAKGEKEEEETVEKIEDSCLRFDHDKKGVRSSWLVEVPCVTVTYYRVQMLSADEYFNVLKLQNGVDCSKEEVKTVCMPLPCSKDGKIKIRDFLYLDIHR